jgi:preprotein translocase subunit YajC
MGNHIVAAAAATKSSGNGFLPLLIIVVLFGLFYVTIIRPQRNRQRAASQTQTQVLPGQRIRTTAGIYGTVVSGDDRDIVVEIAPGVEVTMLRRAVMEVIPEDDEGGMPYPEPDEADDTGETFGDNDPVDDRTDQSI